MRRIHTPIFVIILLLLLPTIIQAQDAGSVDDALLAGSESIELGDLLLDETFDSINDWETYDGEGILQNVIDGQYRLQSKTGDYIWGVNEQAHDNVVMEIEIEVLAGESLGYGVMCRVDNTNGQGYNFDIGNSGLFSINSFQDEGYVELVEWDASDAINTGLNETNTIIVVCVDDYLAMYVNGELLGEAYDSAFSEGVTAMFSYGLGESLTDVAFYNLFMWEASIAGGSDEPDVVEDEGNAQTLTNYGGDWEDTIAELRDNGMIGSGGSLVFQEDHAFFAGQGNWFTPLARYQPFSDVIISGELTFSMGDADQFEYCNLMARIQTNNAGDAVTFINVGFLNSGNMVVIDRFSESVDGNVVMSPNSYDLEEPHHVLLIVQDDNASIYVDGDLVVGTFEVRDRAGTYGISLYGRGPGARCDGNNIWVYQVPSFTPGLCEATAFNTVNRRSGPGTGYSTPGKMNAGTINEVVGQAVGDDGMTWWKMDNDSWVRDDIVNVSGDCDDIPTVR